MVSSSEVVEGFWRLADLASAGLDENELVDSVLSLLAESLGVGVTLLTRVEGDTQYVERVHDRAGMGVEQGAVDLCDTYCLRLLESARHSLVVEDAQQTEPFASLPATEELGIGAYLGVPLYHSWGDLYGTLCALHTARHVPGPGELELMTLAGRILMQSIEAQQTIASERQQAREALEESLVREREAREGAEEALRLRDDFLSLAAHELKTPLTALHLQVQTLRNLVYRGALDPAADRTAQTFETIDRQIKRLTRLSNDLVEISRATFGQLNLSTEEVDLTMLVRQVLEHYWDELHRAGCSVTLQADEPVVGRWDVFRLDQVITNLLANAVKYAAGSRLEITVAQEGPMARLTVRDHGPGIAPEFHQSIFERFQRVPSRTNVTGVGLGLHVVKEVVEAHGGRVWLESEPGQGTTFIVELPLEPTHGPA